MTSAAQTHTAFQFYTGPEHQPFVHHGLQGTCLLLHGFTGTPAEMRPIGHWFQQRDWSAHSPLLPGFGPDITTLSTTTSSDWIDAALTAWQESAHAEQPRLLIGFSMGGALATVLAADSRPDLLILIAPFVRYADKRARWALPVIQRFSPAMKPFKKADFTDPTVQREIKKLLPAVDVSDQATQTLIREQVALPISALRELGKIGRKANRLAPKITCPTLIIQGDADDTVRPAITQKFSKRFAAPVTVATIKGGEHDIPVAKTNQVTNAIEQFLRTHAAVVT